MSAPVTARPPAGRALRLALAVLLWLAGGAAHAGSGPTLGGSFEVRYLAAIGWSGLPPSPALPAASGAPDAAMLLGAHAEATARWQPLALTVRLDPAMLATAGVAAPTWEPGLTEAYALLREGPVDASLGLERLPLETARLTVPYRLEPAAADGTRRGLWGARVSLYTGPLRLRAAGFLAPPTLAPPASGGGSELGGAVSARLDLTAVQIEAHAVYLRAPAFGVSASGTLGQTVLYGEAWLLAEPWGGRGALGASGYLGDALWTLEAAYAPPLAAPAAAALPQLAAQLDLPLAGGDNLRAFATLGLAESVLAPGSLRLQGAATLLWRTGTPQATLELGPSVSSGELGTRALLTARLTAASGF